MPGPALPPILIAGKQVGGLVCEDLWDEGYPLHPPADLLAAGAELLICISASPYRQGIMPQRLFHARRSGCPLVYLNLCGATDELIFDGRSFILDAAGNVMAQLAPFQEEVRVVDLTVQEPAEPPGLGREEELFQALVLGIRDFAHKNHVERAFLGLSGGIDSALTAILAAEALGPERVTAVAIPSRYTDPRSTACARELAERLGIGFAVVELEGLHQAAEAALAPLPAGETPARKCASRLRAMILMSFVNRYGECCSTAATKRSWLWVMRPSMVIWPAPSAPLPI